MSEISLSRWLAWKESQTFERKSCYDKSKTTPTRLDARTVSNTIAETLSAMANADGGVLLAGQEKLRENGEDGGGEITGLGYNESALDLLRSAPTRLVVTPLENAVIETHQEQGKTVLLFRVPASVVAHRLTEGRCLLRVDTRNLPYDQERVAELKRSQSPFERRIVAEATLSDLDEDALTWFADKVGWKGSYADLLNEYDLLINGQLNRAALLLFARKPSRWLDHTEITWVRYYGNERGLGQNYNAAPPKRLSRPLVRLIEETYSALASQFEVHVELRSLFFESESAYPEFAWQEAIVNAVAHRDYAITGAGIEVWLFDDHIDIRSPGTLPAPITIEALQRAAHHEEAPIHQSRNPLIARVLTDCAYMREQGEGVPRMFQAMDEADLAPPELAQYSFLFVVRLRRTPIYDKATRKWLWDFRGAELSREQRRLLVFARSQNMRFTSREVQKLCRLDLYAASNLIKSLIRKRIVYLVEKGGRVYEIISPAVAETLPEDIQRLLPAFQQKEQLLIHDIEALWDLSYFQAYRRIRTLVDAGWLAATAAQGKPSLYALTERSKRATG